MNIFFIGITTIAVLVNIMCYLLFLKGASVGQKEQEDLDQENWIQEHRKY